VRALVASLCALTVACGASDPAPSPAAEPEEATPSREPAPPTEEAARPDALPSEVPTDAFEPEPIRLSVDELPEPFASDSVRRPPEVVEPPDDARLRAPAGFRVQVLAEDVASARWLANTPSGEVLCAQTHENTISILDDEDGDGVADHRGVFGGEPNRMDLPFGMAFAPGSLFVGYQDEVRRFDYAPGQARLEGTGERVTELPGGGYNQHWTRNVVLAPGGERLFVTVGSRTNVDPEPPPRATVFSMRLDGSDRQTFASGLRNPVGLAFHPDTGVPHVTVNERDHIGDGLVPDYFTHLEEGAFYGWPYAYLAPDHLDPRRTNDGRSERPALAARTVTPDVLFEPHSAALGLAFYDGDAFPERYRGGAFVAFRGSWNRSRGTGYMIVFVPFDGEGHAVGHYEPFVTGFLVDPQGPTTWGRPVGVLVRPDGSLLFTDEPGGRIYRVSYRGD